MNFRYLARETLIVFAGIFLILLVIVISGRFAGYLQEAAAGRISATALWMLISLRIPDFVQIVAPFSLFIGIVLTWGRLYVEQEYAALMSGGASPFRLLIWVGGVTVPIAALVAYDSLLLTPAARLTFVNLLADQRIVSEFDAIVAGEFRTFSGGKRVSFAEQVDRESKTIGGVFFADVDGNEITTIWADRGTYYHDPDTGSRHLSLEDGTRYEGTPGQSDYSEVQFAQLIQRIRVDDEPEIPSDTSILPTSALSGENPEHVGELHWRIAMPVLTLVGGFVAFGVARVKPRAGRFGKVLPALLLFVLYYVLLVFGRTAIEDHEQLRVFGLWPVHAVMALWGGWLLHRTWKPV